MKDLSSNRKKKKLQCIIIVFVVIFLIIGIFVFSSVLKLKEKSISSEPETNHTLKDQYGNIHYLSDYEGKVIFLNFWTTWCTYCKKELPDLEEIYQQYGRNQENVIILGVTNPINAQNEYAYDIEENELKEFIMQSDITFPILFDLTGEIYRHYEISSFPTSFLINQEGEIESHFSGIVSKEQLEDKINILLSK